MNKSMSGRAVRCLLVSRGVQDHVPSLPGILSCFAGLRLYGDSVQREGEGGGEGEREKERDRQTRRERERDRERAGERDRERRGRGIEQESVGMEKKGT